MFSLDNDHIDIDVKILPRNLRIFTRSEKYMQQNFILFIPNGMEQVKYSYISVEC